MPYRRPAGVRASGGQLSGGSVLGSQRWLAEVEGRNGPESSSAALELTAARRLEGGHAGGSAPQDVGRRARGHSTRNPSKM